MVHDVRDQQEVGRETHLEDELELVLEAVLDRTRHGWEAPARAVVAPASQKPGRGLSLRYGHLGKVWLAEVEIEVARVRQREGLVCGLGDVVEQRPHGRGVLQVVLGVGPQRVSARQRDDVPDRVQHLVGGGALRARVVDVVGRHRRHSGVSGDPQQSIPQHAVPIAAMVEHLDAISVAERGAPSPGDLYRLRNCARSGETS